MRPGGLPLSRSVLASTSEALSIMGYDVGFLSREEADVLAEADIAPPSWQRTAEAAPVTIVTTSAGDRIGFLRFPALAANLDAPPQDVVDSLSREIEKCRSGVKLLIGLSDWGWLAEQEYLSGDPKFVPDILFGSGRGSGVNGRIRADGRCLWVRAYDMGRSLAEITILQWPERKNSFAWKPAKNYNTESIGLNDRIKDNPAVNAVLE
ncbi:MAG: hypothetical protein H0S80_03575 [Desulfovibrionaceae bacterium]|nr:hypothetical protein [Desulfovibrionaceae bacterium]